MNPQNQPNLHAYTNENIKYLDPREHVRKRPGMYIGGTDKKALHHMVWEVLDDAISEFENTLYNEITISLLPNKTICIADDGLGFPVDTSVSGASELELYMTRISRGGRAWIREREYLASGGLHGIGVSTINALSSFCEVEVKRDGYSWIQCYAEGKPSTVLEQRFPLGEEEGTGTSITFQPDFSIMEENDFDFFLIAERCQELAYLLPQLRFNVQDLRGNGLSITYHYPEGLEAWLKEQTKTEQIIAEPLNIHRDCLVTTKSGYPYMVRVHIACQWIVGNDYIVAGFVNTIGIPDGGSHIDGLTASLEKQFSLMNWERLKHGFVGIIHIWHPDPQFESQTVVRLLNTDVYAPIQESVDALFAAHPEAKEAIQSHFARS